MSKPRLPRWRNQYDRAGCFANNTITTKCFGVWTSHEWRVGENRL